jgi:deazaflavin-dependent oxidoreductase (nitroreductase family)
MTTATHVPPIVRLGNIFTRPLLRAGVKLSGFGHRMYLLTVRGRKSGEPRTTPVVVIEQDGRRYVAAGYGIVDWVRNLRAAGEAILRRGQRHENVQAIELPSGQAALVLKRTLAGNLPSFLTDSYGFTADSPLEEIERATLNHPVFELRSAA